MRHTCLTDLLTNVTILLLNEFAQDGQSISKYDTLRSQSFLILTQIPPVKFKIMYFKI